MVTIYAEKASLAKAIAEALGAGRRIAFFNGEAAGWYAVDEVKANLAEKKKILPPSVKEGGSFGGKYAVKKGETEPPYLKRSGLPKTRPSNGIRTSKRSCGS